MAGSSNLYLEPIINGAVGDMGTNIAAMNTQLSETTRILMNILNNQGLEQHQEAYNGATFSALTLTGGAEGKNIVTYGEVYSYQYQSGFKTSITMQAGKTGGIELKTPDLTGIETIDLSFTHLENAGPIYLILGKNGVENEQIITTPSTNINESVTYTMNIPEEYRTQLNYIRIGYKPTTTVCAFILSGILIGSNNVQFEATPAIAFNANNLLTYSETVSQYFTKNYNNTITAFITIPDINGVATWVSAVLKGNLGGVSIALVDNTTHELIKVLPTATSDISDVQQLSGLALMVTFAGDGNGLKYMSGFSMRYY